MPLLALLLVVIYAALVAVIYAMLLPSCIYYALRRIGTRLRDRRLNHARATLGHALNPQHNDNND